MLTQRMARMNTEALTELRDQAEDKGDWEMVEDIEEEFEKRDEQAEANRGGMNGIPPEF